MTRREAYDAVVVGAGPNGLAAAITLARAGRSVLVREARPTVGGGGRTAELTLPGFQHDVCSSIHPLAVASPFMRSLPLDNLGVTFVQPPAALAHPLDDGTAVMLERSVINTAESLGRDAGTYRRVMAPMVAGWQRLMPDLLGPFPFPPHDLVGLTRFGLASIWPGTWVANALFKETRARALFGGNVAHSMLPLEAPLTAGFGVLLALLGHAVGWPLTRGGTQRLMDALAAQLRALGGEIETDAPVNDLDELPPARHVVLDLTPAEIVRVAARQLPAGYVERLRQYRYGVGVFKLDLALDGPIPWKAPEASRAATVHLGGTLEEIAAGERQSWRGEHPERPFVLLAQTSLFDDTRAPDGCHTVWAYCHVPNGSTRDMTDVIERQIERFAPGFRDRILARSGRNTVAMQAYNPNYVGGDINGGVQDWRQFWTRPVARLVPYSTPNPRLFICSSATPPGGGVHGMCGFHAARAVLRADGRQAHTVSAPQTAAGGSQ